MALFSASRVSPSGNFNNSVLFLVRLVVDFGAIAAQGTQTNLVITTAAGYHGEAIKAGDVVLSVEADDYVSFGTALVVTASFSPAPVGINLQAINPSAGPIDPPESTFWVLVARPQPGNPLP